MVQPDPPRPVLGPLPPPNPVNPFGTPAQQPAASPMPVPVPVPVPPPAPRRPRVWPKILAGVAAVVVLGGLVAGSYFIARGANPNAGPSALASTSTSPSSAPSPSPSPHDIGSRQTDPKPLSVAEVFPNADIRPDAGRNATYHVLKTNELGSCAKAATGKVGSVLAKYRCTQVVRATVTAPVDGYVATLGIANLSTLDGAQSASDAITALGRNTQGSFTGMAASGAAGKLASSPTVFALQSYGHFLLYVVVGRADGKAPTANATIQQIVTDLVQTYLTGVIDARS